MKTCKIARLRAARCWAGVVYGCIAGFCPRGDAVICAGMMRCAWLTPGKYDLSQAPPPAAGG